MVLKKERKKKSHFRNVFQEFKMHRLVYFINPIRIKSQLLYVCFIRLNLPYCGFFKSRSTIFPWLVAERGIWPSLGLSYSDLLQLGEGKLIKQSDDGEVLEQFDLPPEEWRWQKDGPADRGGSMLNAAAAQCHIQTDPSSGSRLLYLHATAGETTRAKHKSQRPSTLR